MTKEYAAFISYRHCPLDTAVAETVHKLIEHYRVPRELRKNKQKHLGMVFRDRDELPLSNNLTEDIFEALDHAQFLIVVCTPETPKSLWVDREIQHFIEKHGRERVLTVLASGTPEESIPKRITHIYGADGVTVEGQIEPLCAFLVDEDKKKVLRNLKSEFLRLVAAMLGCPYDALMQRQKRYRTRKIAAACSVVAVVVLTIMGLLIQWNLDVTQKNEEISQINRQLEEQVCQTQLNESQALTLLSQNQLEQGDRRAALESAIAALPEEQDVRPYYAPAKTALEKALGLYKIGYQPDLSLEQPFGLGTFAFSEDGRYGVGITNHEIVTCYDLFSGEILWELPKLDDYYAESFRFLPEVEGILYTAKGGEQYILDQFTGQVRFSYEFGNRTFPLDISPDQRQMALSDGGCMAFCSLEEARVLWSEPVDSTAAPHPCVGAYNRDGSRFLMICSADFGTGEEQLRGRLFDTADGSLLRDDLLLEQEGEVWQEHVLALDDGGFFLSFAYGGQKICGRFSDDGLLVAQGAFSFEDDYRNGTAFLEQEDKVQQAGGYVYLASPDRICIVNPETCTLEDTHHFWSKLTFHKLFADGSYMASKEDGTFFLYECDQTGNYREARTWKSTMPLEYLYFNTASSNIFVSCGEVLQVIRWAGDPEDPLSTVQLLSHTLSGNLIYLPRFCGVYPSPSGENLLILDTDATVEGEDRHYIYHIPTDTVTEVPLEIGHNGVFSSDEKSILFGDYAYHTQTGELKKLAEDLVTVHAHDQLAGAPVLSAAVQEDTLSWWQDAEAGGVAKVPVEDGKAVAAGQNGYVIVSGGETDSSYWSCQIQTGKWQQMQTGADMITMAKSAPLAAFVVEDCLYIYDLEENRVCRQLEKMGFGCFAMSFLQQDQVLLLANHDGYTLIDVETGNTQTQIPADFSYQGLSAEYMVIREDRSGSCLYIHNVLAETPGLVIETENWTLEWEIQGMLGYLPETDGILCTDYLYQRLYVHPRLSVEELIDLGRKILNGEA